MQRQQDAHESLEARDYHCYHYRLTDFACWAGCRRALDYYNKAARNSPNNWALQQELAQLLLRLKNYEGAEKVCEGRRWSKLCVLVVTTASAPVVFFASR